MYAVLLGLALVCVVASAVLILLRKLRLTGKITSLLAIFASALAGVLHFFLEHNQSSANPMKPSMFFAEHRAILVLSTLGIILSILHRRN
jgi:hypothetical protein